MKDNSLVFEKAIDHWHEETDVVVVGSGFAGLSAALEAYEAGASVIILEKMKSYGGNSIISDGGIAAPGTKLQKKYDINDSPDRMYEDMLKAGLGLNHPEMVRVLVDQANDAFEWSIDYLGVDYLDRIDIFGGHSVPRCYTAKGITGATIIKKQIEKIKEFNIDLRFKSCLKNLVSSSNGRICGVVVRQDYDYKDPERGRDIYILKQEKE